MNKILIVIPARGGSKGIPYKNIYPVNNKPLIEYSLDIAIQLFSLADVAVSSDSEKILEVAQKYKNVFLIKRPAEIAMDISSTEDTLLHALKYMEDKFSKKYDFVITMQPTSPLRTLKTVKEFIENYSKISDFYDSQLTLTASYADYWIKDKEEKFGRLFPNAPRRRQEREPIYIENSMLYITKVKALKETHSVLGKNAIGFIISEIEGIDINDINDITLAEYYINKNVKTK